ncbi:MAG: ComEC/Rec2 family competence protein [Spirochaetales bacterium]|nr:ComEC/Rec2 family competence protein [Spirochaetales bacterium]
MVKLARPAGIADYAKRGPAFLFFLGLVAAALLVMYLNRPELSIAACLIAMGVGGWGAARFSAKGKNDVFAWLALGVASGLLVGGAQSYALAAERAASHTAIPLDAAFSFRLTLTADGVTAQNGVKVYAASLAEAANRSGDRRASASGAVAVFAPNGPDLFWGETIDVEGTLRENQVPGGARFVLNARGRSVMRLGFNSPLLAARAAAVRAFLARIGRLGAPASSLFAALFLGVKDNLEFELRDAFARTGSLHLLALSGLHVGMIAALVLFFLSPLRSKKLKAVLAALFVGAYFFLAGPSPSLLRAVLMLGLGTIGLLLDREVDPLHVLLASAVVVLLVDPESVRSLSFQLSYLALAGILTFGRRLNRALTPFLPGFARGLVSAVIAAQAFTAPLIFQTFGTVYPVGLVASLLLVPLTTAYVWSGTGFLVVSLIPFPPLEEAVRFLMDAQYRLIFGISDFFKNAPGVTVVWSDWLWIPALAAWLALVAGIPVQRRHELRLTG